MTDIQEIVDRDWFMLVSVRQIAEAMNKPNVWVVNQFLKDKINEKTDMQITTFVSVIMRILVL